MVRSLADRTFQFRPFSPQEQRTQEQINHVVQTLAFLRSHLSPGGVAILGDGLGEMFYDALPGDFEFERVSAYCADCGEWLVPKKNLALS